MAGEGIQQAGIELRLRVAASIDANGCGSARNTTPQPSKAVPWVGFAPELAADPVAEAAEAEARGHQRRDEIDHVEEVQAMLARPPRDRDQHPSRPPWKLMPPSPPLKIDSGAAANAGKS